MAGVANDLDHCLVLVLYSLFRRLTVAWCQFCETVLLSAGLASLQRNDLVCLALSCIDSSSYETGWNVRFHITMARVAVCSFRFRVAKVIPNLDLL